MPFTINWLRVGPSNFQVSELAKVLVLTWVCSYCVRKRAELETTLPGLAKPAGLLTRAEAQFGGEMPATKQPPKHERPFETSSC